MMERRKSTVNKKLKRYLDETEKTKEKIAQLQEHLRNVQAMQKQDEDMEIIKSIRGMKLTPRELFELLCGLQEGSFVIAKGKEPEDTLALDKEDEEMVQEASESEDLGYEMEENS